MTLLEGPRALSVVDALSGAVLLETEEFDYGQLRHYFIAVINISLNPDIVFISTNMQDMENEIVGDLRDLGEAATATSGFVRVAHLSSGTPAVDIYLNGELTDVQGLEFTALTEFIELPVGAYDVAVSPAGAGLSGAVLEAELSVGGAQYLTVIAHGFLENDTLELTAVEEDFSDLDRGLFRLSAFHAIPDGGPVAIIRDDGLTIISFLSYPGLEGSEPFAVAELVVGQYGFTIVDATDLTTVIAEIPPIQYGADRNYFIGVIPGSVGYTFDSADLP